MSFMIREERLPVVRQEVRHVWSEAELNHLPLDGSLERLVSGTGVELAIRLATSVASKEPERGVETRWVMVPATWWQHFKESVFPAWLLRTFPVQHKRIAVRFEYEVRELFPHIPVSRADSVVRFRFLENER